MYSFFKGEKVIRSSVNDVNLPQTSHWVASLLKRVLLTPTHLFQTLVVVVAVIMNAKWMKGARESFLVYPSEEKHATHKKKATCVINSRPQHAFEIHTRNKSKWQPLICVPDGSRTLIKNNEAGQGSCTSVLVGLEKPKLGNWWYDTSVWFLICTEVICDGISQHDEFMLIFCFHRPFVVPIVLCCFK